MLLWKQSHYFWHLVYLIFRLDNRLTAALLPGSRMSDITSAHLLTSPSLFACLVAAIDRLLMAGARIAVRNGDLPHFGLEVL